MKSSTRYLFVASFILWASAHGFAQAPAGPAAAPAPAPAPALPAGVLIADLRGEAIPAYGYSSWKDRLKRTANGVTVVGSLGAQGDGGFCSNAFSPTLDLTGVQFVEVALGVGRTNEVPEVTIALADADGTNVSARIRIGQIAPEQSVWFRIPVASMLPGNGEYAGKVAGMDWSKVSMWHLQGDWTTKKPAQFIFIAIRAVR